MGRGEHMAGKTNNPGGRPRTRYVAPHNSRNAFGVWQLPPVAVILHDLRKCGGNLSRFLSKHCPHSDYRESLLVAILDELEKLGNEKHHDEWQALLERSERARLILIEQDVLDSLAPEDLPDEESPGPGRPRKRQPKPITNATQINTLKFLLEKRLPDKYPKVATGLAPRPPAAPPADTSSGAPQAVQEKQLTPEEQLQALLDEAASGS